MKKIRVLLIEDEEGYARLIREMFKEIPGSLYHLSRADTLAGGLSILDTEPVDVLLLDLMLPDSMRLDTLRRVVEHAPFLPVVVLTTLADETTGIAAVQAGAQDYLFKGEVTPALLSRALRYGMERKLTLEALKESEDRYRTIFETTGTATVILGEDLTIEMVNREFEEIFVYPTSEVEGKKRWIDLVARDDSEKVIRYHQGGSEAGGMSRQYECRARDKKGFLHDVYATLASIPGTKKCVMALLDMTTQKALEKKEKQYIRDLTFLSRSAMKFVTLPTADQILRHIGEQLQHRIKDSTVLVASFDQDMQRLHILSVAGMRKGEDAVLQALGKVFEGTSFKITDAVRRKLLKGDLVKVRGGIQKITSGDMPPALATLFDRYFKRGDLYLVGFVSGTDILGGAIIAIEKGSKLGDRSILKTFTNYGSVALRRKIAEEELVAARSRLQQLLDSSPAAIYCAEIKDTGALVYTYMSENIKKILGFEPQETLFDAGFWSKQIFPADRKIFVAEDLPTLYQEGVVAAEYRFKNRDGSFRWIHDEMKLISDSEGKPREVVGYLVDTTERKQVEEALMIKHSAMASLAHPMILTDQELTMVYLNDAAIEAWGAENPEEVIGKSLEEIIGSRQRFQKILLQVTEEGSWRGDLTIPRRDGKALDARMAVNRVKDDMGITCYIVSIDDVSEQRESERESKKYRSMLERMVVKRTSEITELQKKLQEETKIRKQLEKMVAKEKKETSGRSAQKAETTP